MSFLSEEASVEISQPRIGIEFVFPVYTRRVAVGVRDLVIAGYTYRAVSSRIGEVAVSSQASAGSLTITLPMSHEVCQRYMALGVPPTIFVRVWRQQASGTTEMCWSGYVTSLAPEGNVGNLLVPSRSSEAFQRRLPTISAGRLCAHVLYDANCRIDPDDYKIETTVTSFTGRVLIPDNQVMDGDWATWGYLLHVKSGVNVTIQTQRYVIATNTLTLQQPVYGLQLGDDIVIYAGCSHLLTTCATKFSNENNYGGFTQMPVSNPFDRGKWL